MLIINKLKKGEDMFIFGKSKKSIKQIRDKIRECNLYMDNNYRDLAKDAYGEAKAMIEENKNKGELKEKDLKDLSSLLDRAYTRLMHMGHY